MDPMSKVIRFAEVHKHVRDSIAIIEKALSTYQADKTCLSFNGGKDCTAVLHLVHSVMRKQATTTNIERQLTVYYAQLPNHFREESDFVQDTVRRYNLRLLQYSTTSLKESLSKLKQDEPQIEAIFIGTRRDDFKAGTQMQHMMPTDDDWPRFMRVNPLLDWSYSQVWEYIRELQVPYCDLYNQGYSSLGTTDNTRKNSSLLRYQDGKPYYLPAWHLASSQEERRSRSIDKC